MVSRAGPLAVLLVMGVPAVLSCDNTDPCVLDCAGCTAISLVPDPENCHGYYICTNEDLNLSPFLCSPGEWFDPEKRECVKGDCENQCFYTSCHYECKEGVDVVEGSIADLYDCSVYTTCNTDGTEGTRLICPPEKPYFDGKECQTEASRCCACRPYCSEGDQLTSIIDPTNCTNYFFCSEVGIPESSGTCDPGENFNPMEGACSDNMPCIIYCTNVVDPDGCIDVFTCEEIGFFSKCPGICQPQYYYCSSSDLENIVEPGSCGNGKVFHPDTHMCVPPSECP